MHPPPPPFRAELSARVCCTVHDELRLRGRCDCGAAASQRKSIMYIMFQQKTQLL
jgi:hypothetical protein